MCGTTPPCEMTTLPRSLFNLEIRKDKKTDTATVDLNENVLLVVPDSELQVTRHNTLFLVITSGITSQLQDLCSEVLENSGEVD